MGAPAKPLVTRDARFREHAGSPAHPERPQRLEAIERAIAPLLERTSNVPARAASDEEILAVHDRAHLERLRSIEGQRGQLDPDTYFAPRSAEVARLAGGSAIELAQRVAGGESRSAFALLRPPGHHAETSRAMGFCLLNHIAMAARAVQRSCGVERIAILDWDVHHGNGTQRTFEAERDVLFVSLHQYPFYPGTGGLGEQGHGAGEGATLNLPMPAGCGDAEYGLAFEEIVLPALLEFRPEMLFVSAGFDAHARDPLGGMRVSTDGFARMAASVRTVADEVCDGRLMLALEGGYDLEALGETVAAVLDVLAEPTCRPVGRWPDATDEARELVDLYRQAHAGWAFARSAR
jgi:acetoin utilization deacetylase AcuC-like enzyme